MFQKLVIGDLKEDTFPEQNIAEQRIHLFGFSVFRYECHETQGDKGNRQFYFQYALRIRIPTYTTDVPQLKNRWPLVHLRDILQSS